MNNSSYFSKWWPFVCHGSLKSLLYRFLLLPLLAVVDSKSSYGMERDLFKTPDAVGAIQRAKNLAFSRVLSLSLNQKVFQEKFLAFKESSYMNLFLELKDAQIEEGIIGQLNEISKLQGVKFETPVEFSPKLIDLLLPLSKKKLKELEIHLRLPSFETVLRDVWERLANKYGKFSREKAENSLIFNRVFKEEKERIFNVFKKKIEVALTGIQNLEIKMAPSLGAESMSRIYPTKDYSQSPQESSLKKLLGGYSPKNLSFLQPRDLHLSPVKTPKKAKIFYGNGTPSPQKNFEQASLKLPTLQVSGQKIKIGETPSKPQKPKVRFVPFHANFGRTSQEQSFFQVSPAKTLLPLEISGKKIAKNQKKK